MFVRTNADGIGGGFDIAFDIETVGRIGRGHDALGLKPAAEPLPCAIKIILDPPVVGYATVRLMHGRVGKEYLTGKDARAVDGYGKWRVFHPGDQTPILKTLSLR